MFGNVIEIIARMKDEYSGQLAKLNKSVGETAASFVASKLSVTALAAGFGTMLVAAARANNQLIEMNAKLGISVESLSRLKYVADQSEISLEALGAGVRFLNRNIGEALSGNKAAADAFRRIGIEAANLKSLKAEDQLVAIARQFGRLKTDAERTAVAMDLFGRSGVNLVPILRDGGYEMQKLAAEADKLGLTISTETAKSFDIMADAISRMRAQLVAVGQNFLGNLAIAFVGFGSVLDETRFKVAQLNKTIRELEESAAAKGGGNFYTRWATKGLLEQSRAEVAKLNAELEKMEREEQARLARLRRPGRGTKALPKSAEELKAAAEAAMTAFQKEIDSWELVVTVDKLRLPNELANKAIGDMLKEIKAERAAELEEIIPTVRRLAEPLTEAQKGVMEFADALTTGISTAVNNGALSIKSLGRQILAEFSKRALFNAINTLRDAIIKGLSFGSSGTTGGLGGFFAGFMKLFGASEGGQHGPGLRVVGEEGPEIIATKGTSQIINQRQLAFAGSGGNGRSVTMNYNPSYQVSGVDTEAAFRYIEGTRQRDQEEMLRMLYRNGFGRMR